MRVQLFVSCLVDLLYSEVGERTVALLGAGGRLHRPGSISAARTHARAYRRGYGGPVGAATVAQWRDAALSGIASSEAAAAAAEVSLILADVAVASTGAIGWAHRSGRRRAVALVPPRQIALLAEEDLVAGVPEALQRVGLASGSPPPNIVFAAGPSRTSDIERRSIRGVHAPCELNVVVSSYR
jgi:hypothetical protein